MIRSSLESASGERPRVLQKLLTHVWKLALLSYILAMLHVYSMIGGFGPYAEHTRVSEHALMPGLVNVHFNDDALLLRYIQGLTNHKGPKQGFICENLEMVSVPCYLQNWRSTVAIQNLTGTNVYGVVRAHRATGVESMLIVVDNEDIDSLALAMAFISYARKQVYWARDIFVVFADHGEWGLDAFLSSYHFISGAGIHGDILEASGGMIIGGLVVKTHNIPFPSKSPLMTIELNQINGQLPNLDLFNSLVRIASRHTPVIDPIIYNIHEIFKEIHHNPILIPLRAMYTQAFVGIEGTHSVMSKYGVQGLSIGIPARKYYSLKESTLFIEAGVRTLNNILERFHQSYFMYILTSEVNFLSIAFFMPAMAVLLPLLFLAYKEWTEMNAFRIPLAFICLHIPGFLVTLGASYYFTHHSADEISILLLMGALAVPFGLIAPLHHTTYSCMRFLLYLETALICVSVSLLNFSLALACSVIITPLMILLTRAVSEKKKALIRTILTLVCHPLIIMTALLVSIKPYLLFREEKSSEFELITIQTGVVRMLSEYLVFGCWNFPLFAVVGTFIWNSMLCLASVTDVEEGTVIGGDKEKKE